MKKALMILVLTVTAISAVAFPSHTFKDPAAPATFKAPAL